MQAAVSTHLKAPSYSRGFGFLRHIRRPHDSHLSLRRHYETPRPAADFFVLEHFPNPPDQAAAVRGTEPNEQDAVVCSGSEFSKVGEIQILRDQESRIPLRRVPNLAVAPTSQVLFANCVDIVLETRQDYGQTRGKVLVEFDFHQKWGVAGTGRSSSAEAAANAIAARTCSAFRAGKSARISSTESPAARLANTVRSITRVPRNTGSPPQICGSRRILSSWFIGGYP